MAGVLGVVGPLVGIGSSLGGLFGGGGASSVPIPQQYNFQNTGGADTSAYGGIQGLSQYNVPTGNLAQYQSLVQSGVNNPYAPTYQAGANATGSAAYGAGGDILGTSLNALPDVSALLNLGFDPQGALYSQLLQQTNDQSRANASAAGVGSTPYGAGLNNQADTNFNLAWQNNQLQRATQGAGAAGTLLGNVAQGVGAGVGTATTGAGLPYNTFSGINTGALSTLAGQPGYNTAAAANPQTQIQDFLNYLAAATGQQQANNQTGQLGLNQNNLAFNQNQTLGNNLGSSLAGLAKGWGSSSNPFGSIFSNSSSIPSLQGASDAFS